MAKFSQIIKGTRARKRVWLQLGDGPLLSVSLDAQGKGAAVRSEEAIAVDLRPLTSGEQADVLSRARADAVAKGVAEPKDGNPIYDLCEMEHTLCLACVDPESPEHAPQPFFDGGVAQIRSSPDLGRDRVAWLFEQCLLHQDECSPRLRTLDPAAFVASLDILGAEEDGSAADFFASLGPALRWICMRSLAVQRRSAQPHSSPSSSDSGKSGESATRSASNSTPTEAPGR